MKTHTVNAQQNTSNAIANNLPAQKIVVEPELGLEKNHSVAMPIKSMQEVADKSPQVEKMSSYQTMANNSPQTKQVAQLQAIANNYSVQRQEIIQFGKARPGFRKGNYGTMRDKILRTISTTLYNATIDPILGIGDQNLARLHNVSWDDIDQQTNTDKDCEKIQKRFNSSAMLKMIQINSFDVNLAKSYLQLFNLWKQLYTQATTVDSKKALLFEHPGNVYQLGPSNLNSAVGKAFHGNTVSNKKGGREASPASANNVNLSISGMAVKANKNSVDGQGNEYPSNVFPNLKHTRNI